MGCLDHFCILFIDTPATDKQKGDKGLPIIILASRGFLVQMFITLEPHGIFYILIHSNIYLLM